MSNPHQGNIILHGGPADGQAHQVSDAVVRRGVFYVPVPEPFLWDPPHVRRGRTATYMRQTRTEGQPGTCEARTWHEWHHTGTSE